MTDTTTVESLIYVVTQSAARVRLLSDQLESAPDRDCENILRDLHNESNVLSSALSRLSSYADALPEDPTSPTAKGPPDPTESREWGWAVELLNLYFKRGPCKNCGGYLPETDI